MVARAVASPSTDVCRSSEEECSSIASSRLASAFCAAATSVRSSRAAASNAFSVLAVAALCLLSRPVSAACSHIQGMQLFNNRVFQLCKDSLRHCRNAFRFSETQ